MGNNIITEVDAMDGGFDTRSAQTSRTVQKGTTMRDVIKGLIGDFDNLSEGTVTEDDTELRRPVVLDGNTFHLLRKYSNDKVFVDLEEVNVLNDNDVVVGVLPTITSDTGLLGTPKREDAYLSVETLFRPEIIMGQLLDIRSQVNTAYDGQYKVIGLTHSGTISDAQSGRCQSKFDLLIGSQLFGEFNQL